MSTQYACQKPQRRSQVLASGMLNGIDYLEVTSTDQKTLSVHFLFPLPTAPGAVPAAPALTAGNVIIDGGVRITGITVSAVSAAANILTVTCNAAGDRSTYTLRLVTGPDHPAPPAGFDPQLSAVEFSFKVACPSDFDCQQDNTCAPPALPTAQIDYLAKDFASFRQLLLDRLARTMPQWQESHSADMGIALVELLAYAGDQLSYYQDAVATEAYLGTARQRISVRRHARLLDYFMHDGCNARAWVSFEVAPGSPPVPIPIHTQLVTQTRGLPFPLSEAQLETAVAQGAQVFQTLTDITAYPQLDEIYFYTWSDDQCCLPQGATRATLLDQPLQPQGAPARLGLSAGLVPGALLLLEEVVGPASGANADADPRHRQVVRLTAVTLSQDPLNQAFLVEVEWDAADALAFPLCLSAVVTSGQQSVAVPNMSVARGNVVLADQGLAQTQTLPPLPSGVLPYRPHLQDPGLTFAAAYDPSQPASTALQQDPRQALSEITLAAQTGGATWHPVRDLLGSGSNAFHFVVEMNNDGVGVLRFGDGILGAPPVGGMIASYRTGNSSQGNVGAEAIANLVATAAVPLTGVTAVRNPLPAQGGTGGETLDQVRSFAPWAFRTQERAVTVADYAAVAERHPQVKKAQATLRWTGSWYTMFVTVERIHGQPVDDAFRVTLRDFLEQFRLAGYDLEIEAPIFVPLDIAFTVCVAPRYFRSHVESALLDAFSTGVLPGGQPGFFNPDNFTFGQPVYLSQLVAAAMRVPGVKWVDTNDVGTSPNHFRRWGQPSAGETAAGRISMARLEVARLDNDPSQPENGKIQFLMEGGQ
jgi:hypothetical protein